MRECLQTRSDKSVSTNSLCDLASIILKNDYFEKRKLKYHQKCGTAIGNKFAPPNFDLFMAGFQKIIFQNSEFKPSLWFQYLDGIICIWTRFPKTKRLFKLYKQSVSDNQIYHGLIYHRNLLFRCNHNESW